MSNTYWAARPTAVIGSELQARVDAAAGSSVSGTFNSQLNTAYHHYYGISLTGSGPSASYITRGGEQGETVQVRANYVRSMARGVLNIVTTPKLSWEPQAINSDYRSASQTVLASNILEFYWKDRRVSQFAARAVEEAIVFGEGFVFAPWDQSQGEDVAALDGQLVRSGDLSFSNVSSWDVIRDPTVKSYDQLDWVMVRKWVNKHSLAAQYPDNAKEIASATLPGYMSQTGFVDSTFAESDLIPCYYFFHRRTAAIPQGRETIFVSSKAVLSDGELTYKTIPLHRMAAGELIDTPYPYTAFWECLGLQEETDSIQSSLATNITTFASQLVSVEKDEEITVDDLAGGPKVIYRKPGSQPPVPVQLTACPPDAFQHLKNLKGDLQQLMGLNDLNLGAQNTGKLSGSAYALLASMSIQANSDLQTRYTDFVSGVGQGVIEVIQQRCSDERKVAISGQRRRSLVKETSYTGQDLNQVSRVLVTIGNPMSQTAAGRFELAQLFVQQGFAKTPEQLQGVLDTGRLDPLTQSDSQELLLIAAENEGLADGEEQIVSIYDEHGLHVREHRSVMASIEARKNPKLMAAVQQHIGEHIRLMYETDPRVLAALGQQPPMQAAPAAPPDGGQPPDAQQLMSAPSPMDAAADVSMPKPPQNPLTGQQFDPASGGGVVSQ